MKKLFIVTVTGAILSLINPALFADSVTSSGSIAVSATIDPSISITFSSDGSGLALSSGGGTSAATLAFGHVAAYGYSAPSGVTQAVNATGASATAFSVSTPVDVLVMEANSPSASYTLTAALNSADTANTWKIDTTTVTNSTTTITDTGSYNTAQSHTVLVSVPFTNTTGSISNTINFVATAN